MPELPEVETITRALRLPLMGQKIMKVETYTGQLRIPLDIDQRPEILDSKISRVHRRAKFVLIELDNLYVIVLHLGMSGSCRIEKADSPCIRHDHASFFLDNGLIWRFNDPRKFGLIKVCRIENRNSVPEEFKDFPPEPLSDQFSPTYLYKIVKNRKKPIKSVLMDNKLVVGVGNIYANESLFYSKIHPETPGFKLTRVQVAKLIKSTQDVLIQAIKAGGTTIADFSSVDGTEGKFSLDLAVYGRENEPCLECDKSFIIRKVLAGRSTFYCPVCQPEKPRRKRKAG